MKRLVSHALSISLGLLLGTSPVLLAPVRAAETEEPSAHSATAGAPAAAEEGATPEQAPTPGKPSLGLDRLLQPRFELPDSPKPSATRDCNAWAARFDEARGEIKTLEQQVALSREKISAKSQGAYQYSPLGGGETTSDPEVTKLRAQLKRDRESLEAGEKRLRELFVEADLAGVPRSCTEPRS